MLSEKILQMNHARDQQRWPLQSSTANLDANNYFSGSPDFKILPKPDATFIISANKLFSPITQPLSPPQIDPFDFFPANPNHSNGFAHKKDSDCALMPPPSFGNDTLQFEGFKNIFQDIDLGQICTITEEDTQRGESFRTGPLMESFGGQKMGVGDFDECVGRDGREN
jgi:hypothetical protein